MHGLLAIAALAASSVVAWDPRVIARTVKRSSLPAAEFNAPLMARVPRHPSKLTAMAGLGIKHLQGVDGGDFTTSIAGSAGDQEYLVNITIGGQDFLAIIDTGSSDTWLVEKGFQCRNLADVPQDESVCNFGPVFDPESSPTFVNKTGFNFNITYGDFEFLNGVVGYDTVEVAGLTVTNQTIGSVYDAAWNGDGVSSGLIGLAFPDLTDAYNTTDPTKDDASTLVPYDPFFFTAVAEKAVSNPYFSIALNRGTKAGENTSFDAPLGYLSFGGIAPVQVTDTAVTVPVQKLTSSSLGKQFFFWEVDATLSAAGVNGTTASHPILDTGTTLNYVPTALAKSYNEQFATYNQDQQSYVVNCSIDPSTIPAFSVEIGGTTFSIDGQDQILYGTDENGNPLCLSGTQDGGDESDGAILILGDVFLHNVVATFNINTTEVTLTQRAPYTSS